MAATLANIRTAIQQRGYGTDTATAQTELVNSVYRRIVGMHRWRFLEITNNQTITCTVGDDSYSLATLTDLMHLDAVRIEFGTDYPPIDYVNPQEFRDLQHADRDNGVPRYWTRISNTVYLWPVPDKAYKLDIDYIKYPANLSADADTTVIPEPYAQDVLAWGAIAELCFRERDPAGYDLAKNEFGNRLADMLNEYGQPQRQTASTVVRSGFHEQFDEARDPWLSF